MRKVLISCALLLLSGPVCASQFSFEGTSTNDNDVQFFNFNILSATTITLQTFGYGGGINAAGQTILPGGFEPVLQVYDLATGLAEGGPLLPPGSAPDSTRSGAAGSRRSALFGIRTIVAPAGIRTALPAFWQRDQTIGRFDLFRAPDTGYFDIVDAPAAVHTTKDSFYEINGRWMQSDWVEKRLHLLLDLGGPVPSG